MTGAVRDASGTDLFFMARPWSLVAWNRVFR